GDARNDHGRLRGPSVRRPRDVSAQGSPTSAGNPLMRAASMILLLVGCSSGSGSADGEGFVPLFNGKDLTGWVRVNCAPETFRAEGGEIITTGKPMGVIRTDRMYENYVIELDWMHVKPRGNSGLFVHSGAFPAKGTPFTKGHEIQVLD